jgi:hypothetical protein
MSVSVVDDGARVTETVTDTSSQTVTLTVEDAATPDPRPITASEAPVASGTIDLPDDSPKERPKRVSDGWGRED